ncbi:GXWXG protein [Halopseudomonas pachastrellae]|uniref:GXWXG domain-containing protein n=1 Tax=Halopseudomonas pachastrellae TaxID=254161 RepID=UPI0008E149E0|nr:GXWXG domain-containing protein [Halopseudomonas pachastrellae]SFM87025.1 GXWXG protein [Halopseudomonas pachastrellae]
MIASGEAHLADTLMPLFKQLEPVSLDFMLGTWRGASSMAVPNQTRWNWYGIRFTSINDVEPILYPGPDGSLQNYHKLGRAQIREIVFDGTVSAALILRSAADHRLFPQGQR